MNNIVLITGATGFIGRQVANEVSKLGYQVRVVCRPSSNLSVLNDAVIEKVVLTEDLFSEDSCWWHLALEGVYAVIHLAWYVEPKLYIDSPKNISCLKGTLALAEACSASNITQFIGAGTCLEYERSDLPLGIDSPLIATNAYTAAKISCYWNLKYLFSNTSISFSWCRFFYLYGEGEDRRRLVPYVHDQLLAENKVFVANPDLIRDFLDVKLAGKLVAKVLSNNKSGAVNICSGVAESVREIVEKIAKSYGRYDLLTFGERNANVNEPPVVLGICNI
ncbi:NAD-dependent epimerase/dehydratase [Pokkaliibacter plantistimulans]|uniref:NAD-dependent epimerase/dehydratase n=1 Tax=Proteobacteria bacterium 228 TaxID=2083153 RepID=A0A2S5KUV3_9PROT|nr:NAD(P)-dependent oxidoreductase [Pokkaliibacter plantistimulans]PPC78432.1 NAD-dependent epimerase/dehydratase [Pokkaliibacter plantistimulans]